MIGTIHHFWNWLDAAFVVFTLLGYAGLMLERGHEKSLRNPAVRKEKQK